jgi:L-ribulokinase
MQIYADVTGREIKIASSPQASVLGAAMFGAIAAGSEAGGYDSIKDAVEHMASLEKKSFIPIRKNKQVYNQLFTEYRKLYDYFGRWENQVMERLRRKIYKNIINM